MYASLLAEDKEKDLVKIFEQHLPHTLHWYFHKSRSWNKIAKLNQKTKDTVAQFVHYLDCKVWLFCRMNEHLRDGRKSFVDPENICRQNCNLITVPIAIDNPLAVDFGYRDPSNHKLAILLSV